MQHAIAILDSGVGGLTVVKEIMRQLPQEKIIYFGDTARSPYGPRPADEVRLFTRQIVDYLAQFAPKMIVIACNTATAVALDDIRRHVGIPVVGVIHPGARAAIKSTRSGMIGVIGTEGTIRSGAYEQALKRISPGLQVFSLACPRLAPFVERGLFGADEAEDVVRSSLEPIMNVPMDCLILGCTHYPFLADAIGQVMGPGVKLISSADETAREVSAILYHKGLLSESADIPLHQFFCSGDPALFKQIAQTWLSEQISITPVIWQVPNIV
ncbi:glutamate racemase [Gordoniibacillus kamchatkensis]|uniref:Glutamate racemase n=1 Tax=Gordoniibacillus kamchatkensis TaxID=1590651 RepID=A0ABR5AFS1_9BACL|nr:glutamate racemase [Paenibacillus sp. VKM B-2647]KIL39800.1 glutamate racemase [Paenibacillus sp. VKM B-2647]